MNCFKRSVLANVLLSSIWGTLAWAETEVIVTSLEGDPYYGGISRRFSTSDLRKIDVVFTAGYPEEITISFDTSTSITLSSALRQPLAVGFYDTQHDGTGEKLLITTQGSPVDESICDQQGLGNKVANFSIQELELDGSYNVTKLAADAVLQIGRAHV